MSRKEASDYAKASEDTYVVWIQLEVDAAYTDRSGIGPVNPYSLYVDYVVFAPGTGKSKASGHVYQRNRRLGGTPLPRTTGAAEYSLRDAGEEMGEFILTRLKAQSFDNSKTKKPKLEASCGLALRATSLK
jgi:hypothetical protein